MALDGGSELLERRPQTGGCVMNRIATALLLTALALSPGLALADRASSDLEQALIESANTPAEHAALAKYYRAQAADAQAEAKRHEMMAKTYVPSGSTGKVSWGTIKQRQKMSEHCANLSRQSAAAAQDY